MKTRSIEYSLLVFQNNMKLLFIPLTLLTFISCNTHSKEDQIKFLFMDEVEQFKHEMRIVDADFSFPFKTNRIGKLEYDTSDVMIYASYHSRNSDTFWIYTKVEKNFNEIPHKLPVFTSDNIDQLRKIE